MTGGGVVPADQVALPREALEDFRLDRQVTCRLLDGAIQQGERPVRIVAPASTKPSEACKSVRASRTRSEQIDGLFHESARARGVAALERVLGLGQEALDVRARRQSSRQADELRRRLWRPAGRRALGGALELRGDSLVGSQRREREVACALLGIANDTRQPCMDATPL